MTRTFSIGEAKTNLSKLIALAEEGENVELRRGQEPVARLVPLPKSGTVRRKPGALAGRIRLAAVQRRHAARGLDQGLPRQARGR